MAARIEMGACRGECLSHTPYSFNRVLILARCLTAVSRLFARCLHVVSFARFSVEPATTSIRARAWGCSRR